MMRWLATMTVLGAVIVAGGCQRAITDRSLVFVSVEEAMAHVHQQPDTRFVDPRPTQQYASGHIPGAISLPYQDLAQRAQDLDGFAPLIVYGSGRNSTVADAYTKSLMEEGLEEVLTLRGGLAAWRDAGQPVESSSEAGDDDGL